MILQLPIGCSSLRVFTRGQALSPDAKITKPQYTGNVSTKTQKLEFYPIDVLETLQVARGQKIWGLSQLLTYGSESGYPENVDREAVATDKADVLPTTIQNLISRHGQRFSNMVVIKLLLYPLSPWLG